MDKESKRNVERYHWIDAAKGGCILMVVFFHVVVTSYPNFQPNHGESFGIFGVQLHDLIIKNLAPLRMPLFFMISGFLAFNAVTKYKWHEVSKNRIVNFFYLYLLWSLIQWVLVKIIYWTTNKSTSNTSIQAIYTNDFQEYAGMLLLGSTDVWYLYALPVYFIVCKITASRPLIGLAVFLAIHFYGRQYVTNWPAISIFANGIYFGLGCFYGGKFFSTITKFDKKSLAIIAFTLFAAILTRRYFQEFRAIPTSLASIAIGVALFHYLQSLAKLTILRFIGKNTLPIYVIHRTLIEIPDVLSTSASADPSSFEFFGTSITWFFLYPTFMTILLVALSLSIWHITNRGFGIYLYKIPNFDNIKNLRHVLVSSSK